MEELRRFVDGLEDHHRSRALEVACGSGVLTVDLIAEKYDLVDMFDLDPRAIQDSKANTFAIENVQHVEVSSMEAYHFKHKYSAIFIRWGSGYLLEPDLIAFLKRCQQALDNPPLNRTRRAARGAYIILLENVEVEGRKEFLDKGQYIRDRPTIEAMFIKAGLRIVGTPTMVRLHENYKPVMLWALQ